MHPVLRQAHATGGLDRIEARHTLGEQRVGQPIRLDPRVGGHGANGRVNGLTMSIN